MADRKPCPYFWPLLNLLQKCTYKLSRRTELFILRKNSWLIYHNVNSLTQWWWAYYLAEHIIKVDKNLHDQLYYQYRQLVNQTKEKPCWGWVGTNTSKVTVGLNQSFGLKFWWLNFYQGGRGQIVSYKSYHIKHNFFCQTQSHLMSISISCKAKVSLILKLIQPTIPKGSERTLSRQCKSFFILDLYCDNVMMTSQSF